MAIIPAIPRVKEFKFRLEMNGFDAAWVQEFDPGNKSIGQTIHAGAGMNHGVKEAGMLKFDDATLKVVVPIEGPGAIFFNAWITAVQDPVTGNGSRPAVYKRNFTLYELDPDANPVSGRILEFIGGWVSGINKGNRSALTEDRDVIEEITVTYDRYIQR